MSNEDLRRQIMQETLAVQPPALELVPKPRPRRQRKVPLVVHVQADVLAWAKQMACENGRSVSSYINMALGKLAAAGRGS